MCGRYAVFMEQDMIEIRQILQEINQKHAGSELHARMKIGEIFPSDIAPVILPSAEKPQGQADLIKWGFPAYGRSGFVINARSETAAEKNMFRKALAERRCLLPASGFYEWNKTGNGKQKNYLTLPNDPVMYLAGLYGTFHNHQTDEWFDGFVILTTAANESVAPLHDRMPVIVPRDMRADWLNAPSATSFILQLPPPILCVDKVH